MTDIPELLAQSLEDRSIEAAVLCLKGCGTSIINDPAVMRMAAKSLRMVWCISFIAYIIYIGDKDRKKV